MTRYYYGHRVRTPEERKQAEELKAASRKVTKETEQLDTTEWLQDQIEYSKLQWDNIRSYHQREQTVTWKATVKLLTLLADGQRHTRNECIKLVIGTIGDRRMDWIMLHLTRCGIIQRFKIEERIVAYRLTPGVKIKVTDHA